MTERELFEEWAYSNKWNIFRYPKSDYHLKEGQYCDEFVEGAWHGWQAGAASRQGEIDELKKRARDSTRYA